MKARVASVDYVLEDLLLPKVSFSSRPLFRQSFAGRRCAPVALTITRSSFSNNFDLSPLCHGLTRYLFPSAGCCLWIWTISLSSVNAHPFPNLGLRCPIGSCNNNDIVLYNKVRRARVSDRRDPPSMVIVYGRRVAQVRLHCYLRT